MPYGLMEVRQDLIDTARTASPMGRPHRQRRAEGRAGRRQRVRPRGALTEWRYASPPSRSASRRSICSSTARRATSCAEPPAGLLEECRGSAAEPGDAGVPALADRGRHPRLHQRAEGARRPGAAAHAPWPRSPAATAWRRSPPRPTPSPPGTSRSTPTRNATTSWPATCRRPARRLVICGMHVHIGIEDPELRIDFMSQIAYFLPHLLALSTSSPFWGGEDTGLKSYRMASLRRAAAHRPAGAVRQLGRVSSAISTRWSPPA